MCVCVCVCVCVYACVRVLQACSPIYPNPRGCPLSCPHFHPLRRNLGRSVVQGRTQKHLGDLYLLSGLLQDASNNYVDAIGTLSSTRDSLWLASAYEGLSTVAIMSKRCDDAIGQRGHHTKVWLCLCVVCVWCVCGVCGVRVCVVLCI